MRSGLSVLPTFCVSSGEGLGLRMRPATCWKEALSPPLDPSGAASESAYCGCRSRGPRLPCRALLVAFWRRGRRLLPAPREALPRRLGWGWGGGWEGAGAGRRLTLAFSECTCCLPVRRVSTPFSLLLRIGHPEFAPPCATHLEIIETFTNAHLEITIHCSY